MSLRSCLRRIVTFFRAAWSCLFCETPLLVASMRGHVPLGYTWDDNKLYYSCPFPSRQTVLVAYRYWLHGTWHVHLCCPLPSDLAAEITWAGQQGAPKSDPSAPVLQEIYNIIYAPTYEGDFFDPTCVTSCE